MPIVIGKNVNFFLTKFTPKVGHIYPQGVFLPRLRTPALEHKNIELCNAGRISCEIIQIVTEF